MYLAEVTPRKSHGKQQHDHRAARMFLRLYGRDRKSDTLNLRDWDRFIHLRRNGAFGLGSNPRPVRDRQIEYDLAWLKAVFRWAVRAGADGKPFLEHNPVAGYPLPRERSPMRPVITEEQYRALLDIADTIDWRFGLTLVFANETGHRLNSIRTLRWADVDLGETRVLWRSANDKIGFAHVTPMSPALQVAVHRARKNVKSVLDAWLFPAPRNPEEPCPRSTFDKWLRKAVKKAGIDLPAGAGWHGFRRKFATELKHMPLKDLCYLGGWKDPKTLLTCYQTPDEDVMREGLAGRRALGKPVS